MVNDELLSENVSNRRVSMIGIHNLSFTINIKPVARGNCVGVAVEKDILECGSDS
jgi:hypothetical protein